MFDPKATASHLDSTTKRRPQGEQIWSALVSVKAGAAVAAFGSRGEHGLLAIST
jgi:hypothetical protein